jgi:hypothetical protein
MDVSGPEMETARGALTPERGSNGEVGAGGDGRGASMTSGLPPAFDTSDAVTRRFSIVRCTPQRLQKVETTRRGSY